MAEVEKDDLLAEVRAAYDAPDEAAVGDAPVTPPTETADQRSDRARDEQGRFAKEQADKVSRETLRPKEEAVSPNGLDGKPIPAPAGQPSPIAPAGAAPAADDFAVPPAEWKGKAKVEWNKLPAAVRAEISQDYQGLAQSREALAPVEQAIAPFRDVLIRDAGSVESGVSQLMQFYKLFLENPQGLIHHIARTRGIDLGQLMGQPGQGPPASGTPQAPDVNSLIAQAVQQAIAPINQRFEQTETQQIYQTLDQFRADPTHPYFEDVRVDMGRLIETGMAANLPEAYDKACRLNPAIWSAIQSHQTEDAQGSKAAAAEKARKAAAASLRGSPLPNGQSGQTSSNSSVLDDVRAAAAELSGS